MKFGIFTIGPVPKPLENDTWDEDQERRTFQNWLDQYDAADKLGFDYLFMGEHHYKAEYCHMPEPETFLAAVSQRTKNARLGTTIAHISTKDSHPVRVAERASLLDLLSNGRWEFGTGPSGYGDGPQVYGLSEAERETISAHGNEIWEDGLREIVRMMTEEPYPGAETQYFQIPPFTLVPRPVQKPHPPLWRAALTPESNARCARLGLGALNLADTDVEDIGNMVASYWQSLKEGITPIGRAINPATAMFIPMYCARTDEEAERGRRAIDFFAYGLGGGTRGDQSQRQHMNRALDNLLGANGRAGLRVNMNASALVGSPETIRRRLRDYEATNVDVAVFLHITGDTPHECLLESQELFATQVMPEFLDRQEDHVRWRTRQLDGVEGPVNATV